jgi:hypothetical protein
MDHRDSQSTGKWADRLRQAVAAADRGWKATALGVGILLASTLL